MSLIFSNTSCFTSWNCTHWVVLVKVYTMISRDDALNARKFTIRV